MFLARDTTTRGGAMARLGCAAEVAAGVGPAGLGEALEARDGALWKSLDCWPAAVHLLTDGGTIAATNPAFDRMMGTLHGQLVGRHQAALNNASIEANLEFLARVRADVAAHGIWQGTVENRRGDGAVFLTRARFYAMRLAGRQFLVCFQHEPAAAG
jgi:PAS domain-containing protein